MEPETLLARVLTAAGGPLLAEMEPLFGNELANCKLTGAVGRPTTEQKQNSKYSEDLNTKHVQYSRGQ